MLSTLTNSFNQYRTTWYTVIGVLIIFALALLAAASPDIGPERVVAVVNATFRGAIPVMLGAMSGLFSERSGIVNIGIEGMMLTAAFVGYMVNVYLSSPVIALFGMEPVPMPEIVLFEPVRMGIALVLGVLAGGMMGLLHALMTVRFKVDHIISGTVINILALGLTGYMYVGETVTAGRLSPVMPNPFTQDAGLLYWLGNILFNKGIITYAAIILVVAITIGLFRTVWGLRTRAIGEHPRAADTLGINVFRLQYTNLFMSGCLAGLGGVFLTLEGVGSFERNMTNGRGFIALAVLIFGKWHPLGAAAGAILFGFATALQSQLQFFNINVPHQFVGMLPYLLTVIVVAGFVGRSRPPAHVGQSYEVE